MESSTSMLDNELENSIIHGGIYMEKTLLLCSIKEIGISS